MHGHPSLKALIFSGLEGLGWGLDSRGCPENDGERKRREKESLDSRGCPENDGGEEMRVILTALPIRHSHRPPHPSFSPPSSSVILTALPVRHSHRRWESRLFRMCESRPSFSPPSPSVILTALLVRHSHRRWESRLVFSVGFPPDGWEGRDGLDSRAGLENDGGGGMRVSWSGTG